MLLRLDRQRQHKGSFGQAVQHCLLELVCNQEPMGLVEYDAARTWRHVLVESLRKNTNPFWNGRRQFVVGFCCQIFVNFVMGAETQMPATQKTRHQN